MAIRTRKTDEPTGFHRLMAARSEGRRRTLVMSIIAAGMVSWFFGWANDRDQRDRSVKNCQLVQADRLNVAESLEQRADNILGNPEKGIPRADFSQPPYDAFKGFRVLITQNARADRARAKQYRTRVENCWDVFPPADILPSL